MNGLEQIILKIEQESKEKTDKILEETKKEKERILALKDEEAKREAEKILSEAKREADIILKNAKSAGEAEKRNAKARAKAELMKGFVKKALEELENADEKEYFSILKKLIFKYCEKGNGEIVFSEKDKKRLPEGFLKEVNEKIAEKNAFLALSDDTAKITGGFILRYGLIEQNCSFEALLEDKKDEIKDSLALILNEEEERQ